MTTSIPIPVTKLYPHPQILPPLFPKCLIFNPLIFWILNPHVQFFKCWKHSCKISNFKHTCAIFQMLNTLVQYLELWTHLYNISSFEHSCAKTYYDAMAALGWSSCTLWRRTEASGAPARTGESKNHDGNFHPFVYLSDAQNWWRLNSGQNDSRRSQSRSILTNRWNLTSTTFVHPDDAASVYSDPKLMVNNYWIDSWLYFHFHSYSPGMTEGVNINCCWWW